VTYRPALAVGSITQLAAAPERTDLDPQSLGGFFIRLLGLLIHSAAKAASRISKVRPSFEEERMNVRSLSVAQVLR